MAGGPGVAGLVLAAGAGRRYGGPKALVRLDGRLLVDRALDVLRVGGCDPVVVVLGAAAEQVRAQAMLAAARVVVNEDWPAGMGSSLRAGLDAAAESDAVAVMVLLVDTPGITPAAVRRVLALTAPDALAAATYRGRRGHPVLLGRRHWPGVHAAAVGDAGARHYLARHPVTEVACEDVADGTDLDRPVESPVESTVDSPVRGPSGGPTPTPTGPAGGDGRA